MELPKTIWILWLQGFDAAPIVVQKCLQSWKRQNPGWNVVELDQHNLSTWVDLPAIVGGNRPDLTRQATSDIVRINLLATHGGIWVDSTCFCCKPLDEWIGDSIGAGFFAFENPGADRLLSSWFLASQASCELTARYRDAVNAYWKHNYFANQHTAGGKRAVRRLERVASRNVFLTRLWFSAVVSKGLRVYPYYWFHYMLAEVIRKDERCRQVWDRRHRYSADVPHRLQFAGLYEPLSEELKLAIDRQQDPLYKLTWKHQPGGSHDGCTLDYLLNSMDALAH
jgi:hypothetical protein